MSLTVTEPDVTNIVPLMLRVLTLTVHLSAPSVELSAIVLIVNEPLPFSVAVLKLPLTALKSALAVVTWLMV